MTKETNTTTGIDITEFDAVNACGQGHEFELVGLDGVTGTGIKLTVIGKHSEPVTKWISKVVGKSMREQNLAARRGKPVEPKTMDELQEQNIEGACVRVTGWSGVKQPFAQDLLRSALKRNPHFIDQIVAESDDMGNF